MNAGCTDQYSSAVLRGEAIQSWDTGSRRRAARAGAASDPSSFSGRQTNSYESGARRRRSSGSGTATLAAQLQGEAVGMAGRDRRHALLRRGGDAALPVVFVVAASPGEDAAVLRQGEAVDVPGGDRDHAAVRRGEDAALPVMVEVAAPGEDAAVRRQSEAVVEAGGDRLHSASGKGGDAALPNA